MSDEPWSDRPNAPQIPRSWYLAEKGFLAGDLISAILYGIVVALFCQCMIALLSPVNRVGCRIKWWLVAHTAAMFIFLTIPAFIGLRSQSIDFIDNRKFSGDDAYPPGPLGYELMADHGAISIVYAAMFPLNQWLADGFLLYRCIIIYSMNYWVMAFPCLLYLASLGIGISWIYAQSTVNINLSTFIHTGASYYSICLALNVLLTLMIVARLVLHRRNVRNVVGTGDSTSSPYTTIITIIVESYALYAITLLVYIVPYALDSWVVILFRGTGVVQVIAPYLITIRVANRRAVTSEIVSSAYSGVGSIRFRSQGTTDGDGSLLDEGSMRPAEPGGEVLQKPTGPADDHGVEEVPG